MTADPLCEDEKDRWLLGEIPGAFCFLELSLSNCHDLFTQCHLYNVIYAFCVSIIFPGTLPSVDKNRELSCSLTAHGFCGFCDMFYP